MTAINFYILSPQKKLIPFVCQLTQAVLQKSNDGLIIYLPTDMLNLLDDKLWSFSDTAFIPHQIVSTPSTHTQSSLEAILTDNLELLKNFSGTILNLTDKSLVAIIRQPTVNKLLEIIDSDEQNIINGRQKYRDYRDNFPQIAIQTFKI